MRDERAYTGMEAKQPSDRWTVISRSRGNVKLTRSYQIWTLAALIPKWSMLRDRSRARFSEMAACRAPKVDENN